MKFVAFLLLIFAACVMAGLYGILHDQLTYSISPEYYTKFKFYQFGFMDVGNEAIFPNPRIEVSFVGLLATWWMGIPIGLILGLTGLIHKNWKVMFAVTIRAFIVTILIAFVTGLIGLAYGQFYLADIPRTKFVDWYLPDNLIDFRSFVKVGSMHDFSYVGGVLGLLGGIVYSLIRWKQTNVSVNELT